MANGYRAALLFIYINRERAAAAVRILSWGRAARLNEWTFYEIQPFVHVSARAATLRDCRRWPPVLTSNPLPELISGANCVSRGRHLRDARCGPQLTRGRDAERHTGRPVVSALLLIQKAVAAQQRYTPDDAFCIAYSATQWAVGCEF